MTLHGALKSVLRAFYKLLKEGLKLTCFLLSIVLLSSITTVLILTFGEFKESAGFAKARGYEMQIQDPYQPHRPKWRPKVLKI